MQHRYRLVNKNKTKLVEMPFSVMGMQFLRAVRKSDNEFKYQRIKDIIQAYPNHVKIGTIYPTNKEG